MGRSRWLPRMVHWIAPPPGRTLAFFAENIYIFAQLHFMKNSTKFKKICKMVPKDNVILKKFNFINFLQECIKMIKVIFNQTSQCRI